MFSAQALRRTRAASPDDIGRIVSDFSTAARTLEESRFDAIEIHMGHGYLLSSFLSPALNRRNDHFGGDAIRRAEVARRVASGVRAAVGSAIAVTAKLNLDDGAGNRTSADDVVTTIELFERDGSLDAITLTGGSSFRDPMYLLRGAVPLQIGRAHV